MTTQRLLIRTNGTQENLPGPQSLADIRQMIGASTLDFVFLHHLGEPLHIMLVDDNGAINGSPINPAATKLYRANCIPDTTWSICGDVVVVPDDDYAGI